MFAYKIKYIIIAIVTEDFTINLQRLDGVLFVFIF